MWFGRRDPFSYFECSDCGCVQTTAMPENLSEYYPKACFSFRPQHQLVRSRWRRWVDRKRVDPAPEHLGPIGSAANRLATPPNYLEWMRDSARVMGRPDCPRARHRLRGRVADRKAAAMVAFYWRITGSLTRAPRAQ